MREQILRVKEQSAMCVKTIKPDYRQLNNEDYDK